MRPFSRLAFLAAFAVIGTGSAFAADCSVEIEGNDAMQFNKPAIEVSQSCKEFTVKLKHSGKMPKQAMGHNWVLAKTTDMQGIVTDGAAAGIASDYLKPGDARILAHTKVVGGGESDSVTFATAKLSPTESYTYFCSFPGHSAIMKGSLKLVK